MPVRNLKFIATPEKGYASTIPNRPAGAITLLLMLFLWGPRDTLALSKLFEPVVARQGPRATLHEVAGTDHSFKVLKRDSRTEEDVIVELAETTAAWIGEQL